MERTLNSCCYVEELPRKPGGCLVKRRWFDTVWSLVGEFVTKKPPPVTSGGSIGGDSLKKTTSRTLS